MHSSRDFLARIQAKNVWRGMAEVERGQIMEKLSGDGQCPECKVSLAVKVIGRSASMSDDGRPAVTLVGEVFCALCKRAFKIERTAAVEDLLADIRPPEVAQCAG